MSSLVESLVGCDLVKEMRGIIGGEGDGRSWGRLEFAKLSLRCMPCARKPLVSKLTMLRRCISCTLRTTVA